MNISPSVYIPHFKLCKRGFFYMLLCVNLLMFIRVSFLGRDFQTGLYSYIVFLLFLPLIVIPFFQNLFLVSIRNNYILICFVLFIFFEACSILFFFVNEVSYTNIDRAGNFFYNLINCIVFIMLPQIVFFSYGFLLKEYGLLIFRRLNTFFILVGLILFFLRPFKYQGYLNSLYGFGDGYLENIRFLGILDNSMAMGSLSLITTCLYLFGRNLHIKTTNIENLFVVIPIYATLACLQRSAIGLLLVVLFIFLLFKFRRLNLVSIAGMFLFLFGILALTPLFYDVVLNSNVAVRLNNISEGLNRFDSLAQIYNVSPTLLIGLGVGASSHKGEVWSVVNFFDNNYFRVLSDLGIFGFIMFTFLLLFSIKQCFKYNLMCILLLVCLYSAQAFFTNVFDLFYSSFIFWYIIGFLSSLTQVSRRYA